METYFWYQTLIKPTWAPPSWLFGPVWTFLYIVIAITFGYVFYKYLKKQISLEIAAPFLLNLVFNLSFTPLQFGLKNNYLALLDILLVLFTLVLAIVKIWPKYKWVAYWSIPYFIWVSFATTLQATITYLNR
jgi:tryptophan-rich sensory protein